MLTFFKNVGTDELETARLILEILFVLSGIAVAIGVIFEKERFDVGWKILVAALAIEVIFSVFVFNFDSEISRRQKSELVETNLKTEELRADNLALQQEMLPRHLSFNEYSPHPESTPSAAEALHKKVVLIQPVPDFESELFANDIANALSYLGWDAKIVNGSVTHLSDLSFADGVTIFSFPGANGPSNNGVEVQKAMRELAHEEGDEGHDIAPIVLPVTGQSGYPRLDPPIPGAVLIRVGVRQLSSRFFDIRKRALERDAPKAKATH